MKKEMLKTEYGDIYYELSSAKEKPVIIFIHGVGMDLRTFEMQVDFLKSDYSVLVWDLPGHGRSSIKEQNERFTKQSADCLNILMNELGIKKAILVGQSLGSMIVQHFQIKNPKKVIATIHVPGIELTSHIGSWLKIFVPFMMFMFNLIPNKTFYKAFGKHRAIKKDVQKYLSETMGRVGKNLALGITRDMVYDLIDKSPEPEKAPLLITYGEKDLFFIRNAAKKWHRKNTGSNCVIIQNANHIANQDNPEEFNKVLIDFLEELEKK
ncbi:MAG: alpha/beta hydrolase [Bacteroidales bacterium]|nr:alpha/beta hydrolase [Bacteroidales bacterium]